MAKKNPVHQRLLAKALSYPEAYEDHPWGEQVAKVKGKVFLFGGVRDDGGFGISVKLPQSRDAALMLPFAEPTGYGLGKAGWVSARFQAGEDVPEGLLVEWLDESYRAVAPKKLVKLLDAPEAAGPAPAKKPAAPKKKAPAQKASVAKKPAKSRPKRA